MTNLFEVACERIERDMKKPDMVESIADCLVQDHISLMNENESLRQQLTAALDEARMAKVSADEVRITYAEEMRKLSQQLSDSQKREVMLRDTLDYAARTYDSVWTKGMPIICGIVEEALAATEPKP